MVLSPQVIIPTLLAPLIAYRIYRRIRGSFGKQPIQTKRMLLRVVLLAAVGSLLLWLALHSIALLAAGAAGIALGGGLAALGLWLTKWHTDSTGTYYTPNAYLGAAISAALIARIAYRIFAMASGAMTPVVASSGALAPRTGADFLAGYQQSPLTLAIVTVTIGYYLIYFTGLLIAARTRPSSP